VRDLIKSRPLIYPVRIFPKVCGQRPNIHDLVFRLWCFQQRANLFNDSLNDSPNNVIGQVDGDAVLVRTLILLYDGDTFAA